MNEIIKMLVENIRGNNNLRWLRCCTKQYTNFRSGCNYICVAGNEDNFKIIDENGDIQTIYEKDNFKKVKTR